MSADGIFRRMSDVPAVSTNRDIALTVKVEAALAAWVTAEAMADGRTVSSFVRKVLLDRLKQSEGG